VADLSAARSPQRQRFGPPVHHASGLGGLCSWENNEYEWDAILGQGHRDHEVRIYSSPALATDLSGLPPTFIDVGGSELFRDEAVAYAEMLWASGVTTELHVWPGGFQGFDIFAPDVPVSVAAREARNAWLSCTWAYDRTAADDVNMLTAHARKREPAALAGTCTSA
jgi:acetyl esterase/lipase